MNLGIFFGGKSAEHEISCISAASIYENIDRNKYKPYLIGIDYDGNMYHYTGDIDTLKKGEWKKAISEDKIILLDSKNKAGIYGDINIEFDVVFPVMHGPYGEDGKIQGLFEFCNLPYVGASVMASSLCMDKCTTKKVLSFTEIPQVEFITVNYCDDINIIVKKCENIGYPLFVKPSNMGSSVGISKVLNKEALLESINNARKYDTRVIIEKGHSVRELEIAVLGNLNNIIVSNIGEIISCDEFYDYEAKYIKNQSKLITNAEIDENIKENIKMLAKKAYIELGIEGMARIDFFLDKDTNKIYLNEVNTIPGFTSISMYPKLMEDRGISYKELINTLIDLAVERRRRENGLSHR